MLFTDYYDNITWYRLTIMGSATGGGAWGPWLPKERIGGPLVHLAPQIFGKILLCIQLYVQCFSLKKKQWNASIVVYLTLYILYNAFYYKIHVYSQTHLHDLLVAHYSGNRQSTAYNIAFAK